jgi:hypothetical protein
LRTEWSGCDARNPDAQAYVELARSIKDSFFVLSVADLEPGREWLTCDSLPANVEMHRGELCFEELAALAELASLVYCSPGFMIPLAQAVRARLIAVFGGHESARLYDQGRSKELWIQPQQPCECFSKTHKCDKAIYISGAQQRIKEFLKCR